ncbi:hypothetical protein [Streptomyces sp. 8N616]|uniref:hypothetical protein n=1 Tax=Streptomyces sp. 8N616 TaxID=3457414 RepID=UPI003FD64D39
MNSPHHPTEQAPGAPVRSGIPEHGRVPESYAARNRLSALLDELDRFPCLTGSPPSRFGTGP